MSDRIAGSRRQPDSPAPPTAASDPVARPHAGAQYAAGQLAIMAHRCWIVYVVIAVIGCIGGFVIAVGADGDYVRLAIGFGAIVSILVSLLPVLLMCRWAQAYAVDLDMRASKRC